MDMNLTFAIAVASVFAVLFMLTAVSLYEAQNKLSEAKRDLDYQARCANDFREASHATRAKYKRLLGALEQLVECHSEE